MRTSDEGVPHLRHQPGDAGRADDRHEGRHRPDQRVIPGWADLTRGRFHGRANDPVDLGVRGVRAADRRRLTGPTPGVTAKRVNRLWRAGGSAAVAADSRYRVQLGRVHGGLLFSRSPTQLLVAAPGQCRDVDLAACHRSVLGDMTVSLGRPVVWEPGDQRLRLADAVAFLEHEAAGDDAWFVVVSGPLAGGLNTFVPSSRDALTAANHRKRAAVAVAKSTDGGTELLTGEVNAGVVAWATWLVITALPPAARAGYAGLRVESVVFYPRGLVARSGPEYDALCDARVGGPPLGWEQAVDLAVGTRTTVERLDDRFVALAYPAGRLVGRLLAERRAATAAGHAARGRVAKLAANSLYGVLASATLPTGNLVAAQVLAATARAAAWVLTTSLNAVQVNTDGVLFRADQVPAGTLADCLSASPHYLEAISQAG